MPGHWVKYHKIISGKGLGHSNATGSNFVFNFANGNYGNYEVGSNSSSGGAYVQSGGRGGAASVSGQGASAKIEGVTVKVTYKWEPRNGPLQANEKLAPPDPKLGFFLNGGGAAYALGGQESVSFSADGEDSPEDSATYVHVGARRLFSFDTTGDKEFSGTMSLKGTANGDNSASVSFDFSADTDDRSVTLSRSNAHDEWYDGNGVRHGDTTYSYDSYGTDGMRPQINTQNFIASFSGGWTTRTFYSHDTGIPVAYQVKGQDHEWSPSSEGPYRWNQGSFAMPHGDLNLYPSGWDGTAKGQTDLSFGYTVKDNRNNEGEIIAEPKYVLHVHDPVEIISDTSRLDSVLATVFQDNGMPVVRSETDESGTLTYGTAQSSGWSVNWSLDSNVILFLKPLGINFGGGYESSSETYTEKTTPTTSVSPGKYRYLQVRHHYNRHTTNLWAYDTGGKNKRMVDAIADGNYQPPPGEQQEVPHEAFYDKYLGTMSDQFVWSAEVDRGIGAPERDPNAPNDDPRQPNPKLPAPSSNYS